MARCGGADAASERTRSRKLWSLQISGIAGKVEVHWEPAVRGGSDGDGSIAAAGACDEVPRDGTAPKACPRVSASAKPR